MSATAQLMLRRVLFVLAGTATLVLLATPAFAAGADASDNGRGPLGWIDVTDSGGVPIWRYGLDIDNGGFTSPGKLIWAALTNLFFVVLYKPLVSLAVWFIDWVLSMSWFSVLTAPVVALGDGMQHLVDQLGVGLALLTASALIAVFWLARGLWARGIYELAMSAMIFALAAGVFANPVQTIAGPDGAVYQANRLGFEVSHALQEGAAADEDATIDELRKDQSARLSDIFISYPFQVVNFGAVLSEKCQKGYSTAMAEREANDDSDVRDVVKDCDEASGEWAENPSPEMVMSAAVFMPSAFVVLILALVLSAAVLIAGGLALFLAVKLIWDLLQALGPSGLRMGLWSSAAEVVMALAMVIFSSAFLGGLLTTIEFVFLQGRENGDAAVQTFAIVDVVLIVGTVVFWRWRQKIKAAAARLAQALATRPGGAPAAPNRPNTLAPMAQTAMRAAHLVQLRRLGNSRTPATPQLENIDPETYRAPRGATSAEFGTPTPEAGTPSPSTGAGATSTARAAIETAARKRLTAGGINTHGDKTPPPGPSPLATGAVVAAGALTGGAGAGVVQVARQAAQKRPAAPPSPRRAALEARITAPTPTKTPSNASFERVVRGNQVVYVPRRTA